VRDVTIRLVEFPKRNTGPKGRFLFCWGRDAALEGPLFHVTAGGVVRDKIYGERRVEERRFSAASARARTEPSPAGTTE